MKYVIRFFVVLLAPPLGLLFLSILGSGVILNILYYPIFFICKGALPYEGLDDKIWNCFEKRTYKFIDWVFKKEWFK